MGGLGGPLSNLGACSKFTVPRPDKVTQPNYVSRVVIHLISHLINRAYEDGTYLSPTPSVNSTGKTLDLPPSTSASPSLPATSTSILVPLPVPRKELLNVVRSAVKSVAEGGKIYASEVCCFLPLCILSQSHEICLHNHTHYNRSKPKPRKS